MTELSGFSRTLLESAKFFLQQAKSQNEGARKQACLSASLYHGLAYVEAQVNDIAEHFGVNDTFTLHELGTLMERDVVLDHGRFVMRDALKMTRLSDRIDLLATHFRVDPTKLPQYAILKGALKKRNALSHPKENIVLEEGEVAASIEASVAVCSRLAKAIFGKDLPYADRGLVPIPEFA